MLDLFAALKELALTTPEIYGLVQTRVHINKIPRKEVQEAPTRHPPKILVIRQGGGGGKADLLPLVDTTVNCLCYGETDREADKLVRAVYQRFSLLEREIHKGVLIHHLNPTGGFVPSVEPDLVWPVIAQAFTVKAGLLEIR